MNYVKKWQSDNCLVADGIIGYNTLTKFADKHELSKEETAHFWGQTAHESGNFTVGSENLNYSAEGLKRTFRKYFTDLEAIQYARKPEKIANRVYANRMGNGSEASGDGWKYRGRFAIQITGFNNYNDFAEAKGDRDILRNPDVVVGKYFFEGALFYFNKNGLWKYCKEMNTDNITKLSKAINLGNANSKYTPNGLQDRINKTEKFYNILNK